MRIPKPGEKTCTVCGKTKPLSGYYARSGKCKMCRRKRQIEIARGKGVPPKKKAAPFKHAIRRAPWVLMSEAEITKLYNGKTYN